MDSEKYVTSGRTEPQPSSTGCPLALQVAEAPGAEAEQNKKQLEKHIQDLQSSIEKISIIQLKANEGIRKNLEDFKMQYTTLEERLQEVEAELNDSSLIEETMRSEQGIEILRKTYESLLPKVENGSKPDEREKKKKKKDSVT